MSRLRAAAASRFGAALVAALVVTACGQPAPGVIHYDTDACDHCRMTIADPKFAAQLVTRTGKVYRFDDPSCLASFVAAARVAPPEIHSLWLNDHGHPETLANARDAVFVVSDRIRAPMNGGTAAFASREDAARFQSTVRGRLADWAELLARAAS